MRLEKHYERKRHLASWSTKITVTKLLSGRGVIPDASFLGERPTPKMDRPGYSTKGAGFVEEKSKAHLQKKQLLLDQKVYLVLVE